MKSKKYFVSSINRLIVLRTRKIPGTHCNFEVEPKVVIMKLDT